MLKLLSTAPKLRGSIFAPILKRVLDKEMRREHGSLGGIRRYRFDCTGRIGHRVVGYRCLQQFRSLKEPSVRGLERY